MVLLLSSSLPDFVNESDLLFDQLLGLWALKVVLKVPTAYLCYFSASPIPYFKNSPLPQLLVFPTAGQTPILRTTETDLHNRFLPFPLLNAAIGFNVRSTSSLTLWGCAEQGITCLRRCQWTSFWIRFEFMKVHPSDFGQAHKYPQDTRGTGHNSRMSRNPDSLGASRSYYSKSLNVQ
ncbi:hypothetical protein NPIL_327021 [Nephila pilipes]|uniref:Uncharacterized protein n=1 Tax=Nephila pilipes TaxID=299642 RepID=A0A8X6PBZ4_NEPPI|nr:hypothetical protein NPIL_327021 [Nephila pilipes]